MHLESFHSISHLTRGLFHHGTFYVFFWVVPLISLSVPILFAAVSNLPINPHEKF